MLINKEGLDNELVDRELATTFARVTSDEETELNSGYSSKILIHGECHESSTYIGESSSYIGERPITEKSGWKWTQEEINTRRKEMQDHQKALMTENEICQVKLDLKKIRSSRSYFHSLAKKVDILESGVANAKQEYLKRASEIATLRMQVKEQKDRQEKHRLRFHQERECGSSLKNMIPLFVHTERENNLPIGNPVLGGKWFSAWPSGSNSTPRSRGSEQSAISIGSCPNLYRTSRESYRERDHASLERKISYLRTLKTGKETEVQELQNQVAQLTATLETVIALGKRVIASNGTKHAEIQNETSAKIMFGTRNNGQLEKKIHEEVLQDSNANTRFNFPESESRSNKFMTNNTIFKTPSRRSESIFFFV